jgi:Xaa-Pro aminopeptidase
MQSAAQPAAQPPPRYVRPLNLAAYPYFSNEERARRWSLAREALERAEFAALVVPPTGAAWELPHALARYLTHVGGGGSQVAVVFPAQGGPTAITTGAAEWARSQPWCNRLLDAEPSFTGHIVSELRELGQDRARIGVVGLESGEPGMPHGMMAQLHQELPGVTWIDATFLLEAIRAAKSREEIAFLERAAHSAVAALDAVEKQDPTAPLTEQLAAAFQTLGVLGSELPLRGPWREERADLQSTTWEIEAAWGGYRARAARTHVSPQASSAQRDVVALATDLWREALTGTWRPSSAIELREQVAAVIARAATHQGTPITWELTLEGCGLGADLPASKSPESDEPLRPGMVVYARLGVAKRGAAAAYGACLIATSREVRALTP